MYSKVTPLVKTQHILKNEYTSEISKQESIHKADLMILDDKFTKPWKHIQERDDGWKAIVKKPNRKTELQYLHEVHQQRLDDIIEKYKEKEILWAYLIVLHSKNLKYIHTGTDFGYGCYNKYILPFELEILSVGNGKLVASGIPENINQINRGFDMECTKPIEVNTILSQVVFEFKDNLESCCLSEYYGDDEPSFVLDCFVKHIDRNGTYFKHFCTKRESTHCDGFFDSDDNCQNDNLIHTIKKHVRNEDTVYWRLAYNCIRTSFRYEPTTIFCKWCRYGPKCCNLDVNHLITFIH